MDGDKVKKEVLKLKCVGQVCCYTSVIPALHVTPELVPHLL